MVAARGSGLHAGGYRRAGRPRVRLYTPSLAVMWPVMWVLVAGVIVGLLAIPAGAQRIPHFTTGGGEVTLQQCNRASPVQVWDTPSVGATTLVGLADPEGVDAQLFLATLCCEILHFDLPARDLHHLEGNGGSRYGLALG